MGNHRAWGSVHTLRWLGSNKSLWTCLPVWETFPELWGCKGHILGWDQASHDMESPSSRPGKIPAGTCLGTAQQGGWRATCIIKNINDDYLQRGCLEMMQHDVCCTYMRLGCLPLCWYLLYFKKAYTHTTQIHTPVHVEPGSRSKN